MNRRQRKNLVKELVASRDLPKLAEWAQEDKRVVGVLCSLLYERDDLLRWRAIEALGAVAEVVAVSNLEAVRDLLRRLLWSMNDESGAAGWHSPEAIAAIVVNVPALIDKFGVLLGSYLNEAPLERGAHWGVAAIAKVRPGAFSDRVDELIASLTVPDTFIRGCAVFALSALGGDSVDEAIHSLRDDPGTLELYNRDTGELRSTTVGDLVKLVTAKADGTEPGVDVW